MRFPNDPTSAARASVLMGAAVLIAATAHGLSAQAGLGLLSLDAALQPGLIEEARTPAVAPHPRAQEAPESPAHGTLRIERRHAVSARGAGGRAERRDAVRVYSASPAPRLPASNGFVSGRHPAGALVEAGNPPYQCRAAEALQRRWTFDRFAPPRTAA